MTRRIIGIDIGIRNLSFCLLEQANHVAARDAVNGGLRRLSTAIEILDNADVLDWEMFELCPGARNANHCSHSTILNGLIGVFQNNSSHFTWATDVVIEAQPAARMKMLAAAIYALVKNQYPATRVIFQPARTKLSYWGARELERYAPGEMQQSSYSQRKRAAVRLMTKLLSDSQKHSAKVEALSQLRKKDDLADSFLHALSFATLKVLGRE